MDLFYYGSQDVFPPDREDKDDLPRGRDLFCESCTAPVSSEDLRSGQASEAFGLVLCGECRETTDAEERIELYFCDRCQVSVPVYRVDTGEALTGDGRILCVNCRERANHSVLPHLLAAAAAVLLVGGGLWVAVSSRGEPVSAARNADAIAGRRLMERLDEEFSRFRPEEEFRNGVGGGAEALRAERDRVLERLEQAQTSFLQTRSEFRRRMDLLESEGAALHRDIDQLLSEADAER